MKHGFLIPPINFFLTKTAEKDKSNLFLHFRYKGKKLVFHVGITVNPENWNSKKERLIHDQAFNDHEPYTVNGILDRLETICREAYKKEKHNGIPECTALKSYLSGFMQTITAN